MSFLELRNSYSCMDYWPKMKILYALYVVIFGIRSLAFAQGKNVYHFMI